jgi:hypothetical protein
MGHGTEQPRPAVRRKDGQMAGAVCLVMTEYDLHRGSAASIKSVRSLADSRAEDLGDPFGRAGTKTLGKWSPEPGCATVQGRVVNCRSRQPLGPIGHSLRIGHRGRRAKPGWPSGPNLLHLQHAGTLRQVGRIEVRFGLLDCSRFRSGGCGLWRMGGSRSEPRIEGGGFQSEI